MNKNKKNQVRKTKKNKKERDKILNINNKMIFKLRKKLMMENCSLILKFVSIAKSINIVLIIMKRSTNSSLISLKKK